MQTSVMDIPTSQVARLLACVPVGATVPAPLLAETIPEADRVRKHEQIRIAVYVLPKTEAGMMWDGGFRDMCFQRQRIALEDYKPGLDVFRRVS